MLNPIIILIIGGGFALILLIIGIVVTVGSERSVIDERMDQIVKAEEIIDVDVDIAARAPITDWLDKRVAGSSLADKISKKLARADIKMKPAEYIALLIISSVGIGFILWLMSGRNLQALLYAFPGSILGLFLPNMYVNRQQGQRLKNFDDQLPDMLGLMVNGLRAGYSTMQAMEAVSKEMPAPICDEFRRVVQEMQLGVPMERALDNLLRRIPSPDLDLVITAINVQREVGGNLAEIMDTISFTIRERIRIKGEIRVLTTQVMYSGKFLSLLPIFVLAALYLMNRSYMMEFFQNPPCGYIALGLAAFLIIMGYVVMNKLADIEI